MIKGAVNLAVNPNNNIIVKVKVFVNILLKSVSKRMSLCLCLLGDYISEKVSCYFLLSLASILFNNSKFHFFEDIYSIFLLYNLAIFFQSCHILKTVNNNFTTVISFELKKLHLNNESGFF